MKKVLISITTRYDSANYFGLCYPSVLANVGDFELTIMVLDYGVEKTAMFQNAAKHNKQTIYTHRPNAGFCSNINFSIAMGLFLGYDYIGHVNDDAILPSNFVHEGLKLLDNPPDVRAIGFVGGVQQDCDTSEISISDMTLMQFDPAQDRDEMIDDITGKWGDFSAWIAKSGALKDTGKLDEAFDPTGILADNDYLIRMRKAGWEPYRNYRMPYLHAKGVTQRKYREGWPNDEVSQKNVAYFIGKWGTHPWQGARETLYDTPFGKEVEDDRVCSTLEEAEIIKEMYFGE